MRILVIGDTHVPDRADEIPTPIKEFIRQGYDILVFTGDATTKEILSEITKMSGADIVYAVRGNMDYLKLPLQEVFTVKGIKFGVIHGHGVYPRGDRKKLEEMAVKMGVDVLISGHTHRYDVYEGKVILLNPGSATGVWSGGNASMIPSAMCVEVDEKINIVLCLNGKYEFFELHSI